MGNQEQDTKLKWRREDYSGRRCVEMTEDRTRGRSFFLDHPGRPGCGGGL